MSCSHGARAPLLRRFGTFQRDEAGRARLGEARGLFLAVAPGTPRATISRRRGAGDFFPCMALRCLKVFTFLRRRRSAPFLTASSPAARSCSPCGHGVGLVAGGDLQPGSSRNLLACTAECPPPTSGTPELVLLLTFPQQPACPQPPLPPSQALCRAVARRAPLSQRTKAASKQPPRLRFTPRRAGTGNHLGNKTKKKQNTLAREIYHNGAF